MNDKLNKVKTVLHATKTTKQEMNVRQLYTLHKTTNNYDNSRGSGKIIQ